MPCPVISGVEGQTDMLLALEKVLLPATRIPDRKHEEDNKRLNITVVFTSVGSTLAAMKRAGVLARSLGARIVLIVPQVVPFPLPLESPPVLLDWNERRFHTIAEASPVETVVRLYLCRDRIETLKNALSPKSLVVVGGPKMWWPLSGERGLTRKLRRQGHEVIFTETE